MFDRLKRWWRARRRTAAETPTAPTTQLAPPPNFERDTAIVTDDGDGSRAPVAEQAQPPRNMAGTPLHLYFERLAPDQQAWFLERERDWLDRVDLPRQDFHLVPGPADGGQGWEVRLGSPTGPLLPVACPFAVGPWNVRNKVLPWRLVHLFMDRNEIEGQLVVLRKDGQWHETETVRRP